MLTFFLFPVIYYGIYLLYKNYKKSSSGVERRRLLYLLTGCTLAVTAGITDFLPTFGIHAVPFGSFFNMIYALIMAFAIIRYRLMDLEIMLKKTILFFLLVIFMSTIYVILALNLYITPAILFLSVILTTVLIIFLLDFVLRRPNEFIDRFIYGTRQDYRKKFKEFRNALQTEMNRRILLERFVFVVSKALSVPDASINFIGDTIEKNSNLVKWLEKNKTFLVKEELEEKLLFEDIEKNEKAQINTILDKLRKMNSLLVVPLLVKGEILGILRLGGKDTGEAFFSDEADALMDLANEVSLTLYNLRMFEKMQLMDRLAYLGEMAAGVAHEVKNPLGVITITAQYLKQDAEKKGYSQEYADIILEESNRMNDVVSRFMDFARPLKPKLNVGDLNNFITKVLEVVKNDRRFDKIIISTGFTNDTPKILFDQELLRQVFINIILNAEQAMPNGGNLEISTNLEGSNVQISFKDTGCGIPKENIDKLFTPFFTTKEKGSGLGLAICRRIIEAHSGKINVTSTEGKGTIFSIFLPLPKKGEI